MPVNNKLEAETAESMTRPTLSVVPNMPEQPILTPFERSHFSESAIAIRIGSVATDLKQIYQRVSALEPDADAKDASTKAAKPKQIDYDTERRNKRREMAAKLFQEFNMLSDTAVTDFSEIYSEAEKVTTDPETPRMKLVDTVEAFEEHPVIRAAMALARTSNDGAVKDDVMILQRTSAMLLERVEPPEVWKSELS